MFRIVHAETGEQYAQAGGGFLRIMPLRSVLILGSRGSRELLLWNLC